MILPDKDYIVPYKRISPAQGNLMKLLNFQYGALRHNHSFRTLFPVCLFVAFIMLPRKAWSQLSQQLASSDELKKLTVEELMNIEVTSVSKVPEKLSEVASAIQVITQQDIRRSAATSVPEALRLCPNLQVTQLNSHHWIIGARGFNSTYSNKLLVMIDGRSVYSPLFAGVFWDAQNVMLEDIDRIEVISGPGAALWGANAVNGVINIITKSAKDTQGLFVSAGTGYIRGLLTSAGTSSLKSLVEARYGGSIGSKFSYRVYGYHRDRDHTFRANGQDNTDKWSFSQGGFDMNWNLSNVNELSFQGNFYGGEEHTKPELSTIDGQNMMGKWKHHFSNSSDLTIQAYFDRTWRHDIPSTINDELVTYDFDLQHRFLLGKRQNILWGIGCRFMNDHTQHSTPFVAFLPGHRNMDLFSSFVQDEFTLFPDLFKITLGTKFEHNDFSGFELQPSARVTFTPLKQNIIWAAVSRAVRSPSRFDVDYYQPAYPVPPTSQSVAGGPDFTSEKMIAYELGYRVQPSSNTSLSLAVYYNRYDDLYSVEQLPGTKTYQIQNGAKGHSRGVELSGNYALSSNWRLRGGYTYFYKKLKNKPGNTADPSVLTILGNDAENQFIVQSILDLPENFQLDLTGRYVSALPATMYNVYVPSYFTLDTRIAWQFRKKKLEFSLNGQNLLDKRHAEVNGIQIPRSVYGKITWRY